MNRKLKVLISLLKSSAVVFGVMWLFLEPISILIKDVGDIGWSIYFAMIAISIILSFILFYPKSNFSKTISHYNMTITFTDSDILEAKGNILIGASDTFDTELGDIISPDSLQGQLVSKVYNSDITVFDKDVEEQLADKQYEDDVLKSFGKTKRYPLGTTLCLCRNNCRYFMLAYSEMRSDEKRVTTKIESLWDSLTSAWKVIRDKGNHSELHVPLIGTKYARTGLSNDLVIKLIILSFIFEARNEGICEVLNIHIHKSVKKEIDFVSLREWIDSV